MLTNKPTDDHLYMSVSFAGKTWWFETSDVELGLLVNTGGFPVLLIESVDQEHMTRAQTQELIDDFRRFREGCAAATQRTGAEELEEGEWLRRR